MLSIPLNHTEPCTGRPSTATDTCKDIDSTVSHLNYPLLLHFKVHNFLASYRSRKSLSVMLLRDEGNAQFMIEMRTSGMSKEIPIVGLALSIFLVSKVRVPYLPL
jgi:hypothetical protein